MDKIKEFLISKKSLKYRNRKMIWGRSVMIKILIKHRELPKEYWFRYDHRVTSISK